MSKEVVIIGAGGHGKVIADIIEKSGDKVYGFLDDNKIIGEEIISDYKVLGNIDKAKQLQNENENLYFVIAIGDNFARKTIQNKNILNYYIAIHPSANIGINVQIGKGTVIMANACINANSKIGIGCIINTAAVIEHDNVLGNYVHVSPNATLCGTVNIKECTWIGAGSIIKNNININKTATIGAGAVVVKDINDEGMYVGVPAENI